MKSSAPQWAIERIDRIGSTQAWARGRPAWSAVVALEQTAGRGQAERRFVSDPGGLYVTAVLPYGGDPLASRGFALAVGWALCGMLRKLGAAELRLRWPNDLLAGTRKVGGILVEQGGPDTLLVGVGLNVTNRPWLADPGLAAVAGRLADVLTERGLPPLEQLALSVLTAVSLARETFARERLAGMVEQLRGCWGEPRVVELLPAAGMQLPAAQGRFRGIDADGRLLLEGAGGALVPVPAHHVARLREVGAALPSAA